MAISALTPLSSFSFFPNEPPTNRSSRLPSNRVLAGSLLLDLATDIAIVLKALIINIYEKVNKAKL